MKMQANDSNSNTSHHIIHEYNDDCEEFNKECWPLPGEQTISEEEFMEFVKTGKLEKLNNERS